MQDNDEHGEKKKMSVKKQHRKGYFFMLDGFLAVIILFVGFVLILSTNPARSSILINKHSSRDIMNLFSNTRLHEIEVDCAGMQRNIDIILCSEEGIYNENNTITELIGELHARGSSIALLTSLKGYPDTPLDTGSGCSSCSPEVVSKYLLNELLYEGELMNHDIFGVAVILDTNSGKKVIYNSETGITYDISSDMNLFYGDMNIKRSNTLLLSRKMIIGYWEEKPTIEFWGPFTVEFWVWNKR
ncbi:MAG: hypothetical protein KKF44_03535 [Nanoarchaeota archaeon]|nr:hypothetical protein [Nanoarchaeota archaeon]